MTETTTLHFATYDACEAAAELLEEAGEEVTELPNYGKRPKSLRIWNDTE